MKIETLLLLAFLAPTVNDCESTEYVQNSRAIVDGKIVNKDGTPAKNVDISFTNYISTTVSKTDENGGFKMSLPGTTDGFSFSVKKEIENFTCSEPGINVNYIYDYNLNTSTSTFNIPRDMSYVNFSTIQLK